MFFTFLNCANGTKSRNASHTIQGHSFSRKKFSWVLFFSLFSNCLIIYQYLIVTRTSFIWHVHIQNWVSFSRSWKNQNWLHLMQLKHLKTEQHKRNSLYWRPARQDSRYSSEGSTMISPKIDMIHWIMKNWKTVCSFVLMRRPEDLSRNDMTQKYM